MELRVGAFFFARVVPASGLGPVWRQGGSEAAPPLSLRCTSAGESPNHPRLHPTQNGRIPRGGLSVLIPSRTPRMALSERPIAAWETNDPSDAAVLAATCDGALLVVSSGDSLRVLERRVEADSMCRRMCRFPPVRRGRAPRGAQRWRLLAAAAAPLLVVQRLGYYLQPHRTTLRQSRRLKGHRAPVTAVSAHPALPRSAHSGSLDGDVRTWDLDTGACVRVVGVGAPVTALVAAGRLAWVATAAGADTLAAPDTSRRPRPGRIRVLDLSRGETVRSHRSRAPRPGPLSYGGGSVAVLDRSSLCVYPSDPSAAGRIKVAHTRRLTAVAVASQPPVGAISGAKGSSRHPSMAMGDATGRIILLHAGEGGGGGGLGGDASASGRGAAGGSGGPGVPRTPRSSQMVTTTWHWHRDAVSCLCFGAGGAMLLSGGAEGVVVIWDVSTGNRRFLPRLGAPLLQLCAVGVGTTGDGAEGGKGGGAEEGGLSGSTFAALTALGSVAVLDVATMKVQARLVGLAPAPAPALLGPGGGLGGGFSYRGGAGFGREARLCGSRGRATGVAAAASAALPGGRLLVPGALATVQALDPATGLVESATRVDRGGDGGASRSGGAGRAVVTLVGACRAGRVAAAVTTAGQGASGAPDELVILVPAAASGDGTAAAAGPGATWAPGGRWTVVARAPDPHAGAAVVGLAAASNVVATSDADGCVKIWRVQRSRGDVAPRLLLAQIAHLADAPVGPLALTDDGTVLAVANNGHIVLLDSRDTSVSLGASISLPHGAEVGTLAFSPGTGRFLTAALPRGGRGGDGGLGGRAAGAASSAAAALMTWDVGTGRVMTHLSGLSASATGPAKTVALVAMPLASSGVDQGDGDDDSAPTVVVAALGPGGTARWARPVLSPFLGLAGTSDGGAALVTGSGISMVGGNRDAGAAEDPGPLVATAIPMTKGGASTLGARVSGREDAAAAAIGGASADAGWAIATLPSRALPEPNELALGLLSMC